MNFDDTHTDLREYLSKHIPADKKNAAGVPIMLLTCMDSRYPQRILETMDSLDLRGKYDQLILAGASLGVVHKNEWKQTFLDQLGFALEHHGDAFGLQPALHQQSVGGVGTRVDLHQSFLIHGSMVPRERRT